jgi:cellulose synthase/poly-beta-1,6-N-acetylglucosamine synthase-like glycosyltransferase
MPDLVAYLILGLYAITLALLSLYGLNFIRLVWFAVRDRRLRPAVASVVDWPSVTVQLPIYNERYVVDRLLASVARLDYPGPLQIQVLDDSTDDTVAIVAREVELLRERGLDIAHIWRSNRAGFKAGALASALQSATGELIALFDADFMPLPDFLLRTVPVLCADPGLAFVQARWDHIEPDASLLASVQALSIDGHFAVEQQGRWSSGDWLNFNGTAGIWRRIAIEDAGGWQSTTLTEDLDLSYRALLRGWRPAFVRDVDVPAELPPGIVGYRRQQARWARGSLECAWLHTPAILRAPISIPKRLRAVLHLTGYGIHLLLLALCVLYPLVLLALAGHRDTLGVLSLIGVLGIPALAPTAVLVAGEAILGRLRPAALPKVALLSLVGIGMMANTGRAALDAVLGRTRRFERTPKYGTGTGSGEWRNLGYQVRGGTTAIVELALAALNAHTTVDAIREHVWAIAFFTALFAAGLALVGGMTVAESVRAIWRQRQGTAVVGEGDAPAFLVPADG